jgi:hypothetical protein
VINKTDKHPFIFVGREGQGFLEKYYSIPSLRNNKGYKWMWDRLEIFSKTGGTDLDVRGREIILVIGFIYFVAP